MGRRESTMFGISYYIRLDEIHYDDFLSDHELESILSIPHSRLPIPAYAPGNVDIAQFSSSPDEGLD